MKYIYLPKARKAIIALVVLLSFLACNASEMTSGYTSSDIALIIRNTCKAIESFEYINEENNAAGSTERLLWKELANGTFFAELDIADRGDKLFHRLSFDGSQYQHASSESNQLQTSKAPPYVLQLKDKSPFIFLRFINNKQYPYPTFSSTNNANLMADFESRIKNIVADSETQDISFDVINGYNDSLSKPVQFKVTLSKANSYFPISWESILEDGSRVEKYESKRIGFDSHASSGLQIMYAKEYLFQRFIHKANVTIKVDVEETINQLKKSKAFELYPLPDGVTRDEFQSEALKQIREKLSKKENNNIITQLLTINSISFNKLAEESLYIDPSLFRGIHDLDSNTYIPMPCE